MARRRQPPPERLTLAEASQLTGLSKPALARRIERGSLPAKKEKDGKRYVTLRDLARAGLIDPATGERPAWSRAPIDPNAVARELVRTVIDQGIAIYELRRQLADLAEKSEAEDEELRRELEQARRERAELRRQIRRR